MEPRHHDEAWACGRVGPVLVVVWRGEPTRARLVDCVRALEETSLAHDGPIGFLSVLEPTTPPPSVDDQAIGSRGIERIEALQSACVVLEDRGPESAEMLDALAQIGALAQRRPALKYCADASEGAVWIARRHPGVTRETLLEAIELTRRTIGG